jgi:hypothetical protein
MPCMATVANKVTYNYKQKEGELMVECCGFGLRLWLCIYIFFPDVMDPEAEFYKKVSIDAEKVPLQLKNRLLGSIKQPTFPLKGRLFWSIK